MVIAQSHARNAPDRVGSPMLLAPSGGENNVQGKDTLEFRWQVPMRHFTSRQYFDFRIYKGNQTVESTLIFKTQLPRNAHKYEVSTDIFENGQTYTWTLRYIIGIEKSPRSYRTIIIIK